MSMSIEELALRYRRSYRTIAKERLMRQRVFAKRPSELAEKLAEMDQLMADVAAIKDELKRRILLEQPKQDTLIELPPERRAY